jgi:hypothetical protein
MSDFTAAPYRGDAGVPHAREGNFTVRAAARRARAAPAALTRAAVRQAFIGGCWVLLGAQFVRDVVELRPAWKCAAAAGRSAARAQAP